jgi:hypothetical protein
MPQTEFSKGFFRKNIKSLRKIKEFYLHSHDILVFPTTTSSLASIAIRAASQYSVSAPSEMTPPPIS